MPHGVLRPVVYCAKTRKKMKWLVVPEQRRVCAIEEIQ
jgi:hypothetical protein